jgi:hypothetical protein
MKKWIVCLVVACGFAPASAQEYGLFNHVGINAGVGSEGISVGLATPITEYLELSAGVNIMPGIKIKDDESINVSTPIPGYSLKTLKIEGNLARTTFDVKLSVYPGGDSFPMYLVGGFSFGGEKLGKLEGFSPEVAQLYQDFPQYAGVISTHLDEYELRFDRQGYVKGDVRVKKFRPYVGFGFGRQIPKNRIGFRFELGCQFMGKMKIYQDDQEISATLKDKSDGDFSKVIDKLKVYPVLRLTLTGRIL